MKLLVRQRDYEGREAAHALEEVAEVNDLAERASRYCALLNSRAGGGGATSIVACTPAFRVGALASAETPVERAPAKTRTGPRIASRDGYAVSRSWASIHDGTAGAARVGSVQEVGRRRGLDPARAVHGVCAVAEREPDLRAL